MPNPSEIERQFKWCVHYGDTADGQACCELEWFDTREEALEFISELYVDYRENARLLYADEETIPPETLKGKR